MYIKAEPIDPLKMDLGAEELDMKPEVAAEPEDEAESEAEEDQHAVAFSLAAVAGGGAGDQLDGAQELSSSAKTALVKSALKRICSAGTDGAAPAIWVPLAVRLVTRGLQISPEESEDEDHKRQVDERRDELRKILFEFVSVDIRNRCVVVSECTLKVASC